MTGDVTALLHHVDVDRLRDAYRAINPNAAPGVDKVTWAAYGQDLEDDLRGLHQRLHVACQRDGTTALPRAWDHLGAWLIMAVIGRSGQRRHAVRVGFVGGRTVLR